MQQMAGWDPLEARGSHFTWIIGHLKAGVTPAAAAADLNTIAASLAKSYPKEDDGLKFYAVTAGTRRKYAGRASPHLYGWIDVPGRADPAGRLRQPRQPLYRSDNGSLPRDGSTHGPGIAAQADPATTFHRSDPDLARRRCLRHGRSRRHSSGVEHMAACAWHPDQCTGQSGRAGPTPWRCCWRCSADFSLPWFRCVRYCAPIPGRSSARDLPASAACGGLPFAMFCLPANRHLRHPGYSFPGCGARPGAFAAQ